MFPHNTRTLVVDDMASIRELVKSQLRMMGFTDLAEADDGESAFELISSDHYDGKPIELVICDWNMPKMDGMQLLKKLKSMPEFEKIAFVLLTSEAERDQVTEAVLAGVSQYIVKPFTGKIFEDKLKAAWNKYKKTK